MYLKKMLRNQQGSLSNKARATPSTRPLRSPHPPCSAQKMIRCHPPIFYKKCTILLVINRNNQVLVSDKSLRHGEGGAPRSLFIFCHSSPPTRTLGAHLRGSPAGCHPLYLSASLVIPVERRRCSSRPARTPVPATRTSGGHRSRRSICR